MDEKTTRTVQRILKVNHAGEFGAIRIYRAQLFVSKILHRDLVAFLAYTLAHEVEHCRKFLSAMPAYQGRPCRMMWLWGMGGYLLGLLTALMGRNAIMICTASVEKTVHVHLEDQIGFLNKRDDGLRALIQEIQIEENEHLEFAETNMKPSVLHRPLYGLIAASTELVIWLSTQGDVTKMKKAISQRSSV